MKGLWKEVKPLDGGESYFVNVETGESKYEAGPSDRSYADDDEDDDNFQMTFSDDDEEEEEGPRAGGVVVPKTMPGYSAVTTVAQASLESDSDDEEAFSLPPQTHRLLTRMATRSHRGLRACDDKCALKHHLEGSGTMPESYDLPQEADAFLEAARLREEEQRMAGSNAPAWIFKEATMSRGRGINLVSDLSEAEVAATTQVRGVTQRYLEPLLVDGYKWDLRLYVLMTSIRPCEVFLHDEGFARFSGQQYSNENQDLSVHLTNTAVSSGRGCGGDANVITTSSLWEKLSAMGHDTEKMKAQVDELVAKVFSVVGPAVVQTRKDTDGEGADEFSLLGVDVIFDADLKPWLLEINYNPDMTCHAELQRPVKVSVIHDVYDLVFKSDGDKLTDNIADVDGLNWEPVTRSAGTRPHLQGGFRQLPMPTDNH